MNFSKLIVQGALAAVALACWATSASAAGEVQLLKANSVYSSYKNSYHRGRFEALVANLAYAKNVSIYMKKTDGSWTDFPLSYNRPAGNDKEIWSADFANTLPSYADPLEFVVKYQVNGQTYWDNNNGANYTIARNGGTVLIGPVVWDNYRQQGYAGNVYYGSVTLKNIAQAKEVKVHYSTDGWKTPRVAKAVFNPSYWSNQYVWLNNPNSYGFEEWQYELWVDTATQVEYAIEYKVDGKTYWDNNFGRNYVTTIQRY